MSPILSSLFTTAGGLLGGLALAGGLLWRQHHALLRARHEAGHDDTTGLPNRRVLLRALNRALASGRPCGLVLLDLDGFKNVNDTLGHEAGNDVLAAVGWRLAALPAPVVLAARLSGDEFALLARGGPDQTARAARLGRQAITAGPVAVGGHLVPVRASVGYATAHPDQSARDLLHQADQAMYRAKNNTTGIAGYLPADNGRRPRRRRREHGA